MRIFDTLLSRKIVESRIPESELDCLVFVVLNGPTRPFCFFSSFSSNTEHVTISGDVIDCSYNYIIAWEASRRTQAVLGAEISTLCKWE